MKKRVIKFRGKRHDNIGEDWVYGYFIQEPNGTCWIEHYTKPSGFRMTTQVHPESVGQFVGLKDKNGNEIYEGDVLAYPRESSWDKENYSCFETFFHDGDENVGYGIGYAFRMHNHGAIAGGYNPPCKPKQVSQMEIIGNIFENPELLK